MSCTAVYTVSRQRRTNFRFKDVFHRTKGLFSQYHSARFTIFNRIFSILGYHSSKDDMNCLRRVFKSGLDSRWLDREVTVIGGTYLAMAYGTLTSCLLWIITKRVWMLGGVVQRWRRACGHRNSLKLIWRDRSRKFSFVNVKAPPSGEMQVPFRPIVIGDALCEPIGCIPFSG